MPQWPPAVRLCCFAPHCYTLATLAPHLLSICHFVLCSQQLLDFSGALLLLLLLLLSIIIIVVVVGSVVARKLRHNCLQVVSHVGVYAVVGVLCYCQHTYIYILATNTYTLILPHPLLTLPSAMWGIAATLLSRVVAVCHKSGANKNGVHRQHHRNNNNIHTINSIAIIIDTVIGIAFCLVFGCAHHNVVDATFFFLELLVLS